MCPFTTSSPGYCRLKATEAGAGATEALWHIHTLLDKDNRLAVSGRVEAVFDRTLYLSLPVPDGEDNPPLIALGGPSLRPGPLLVHVDTPPEFSFRNIGMQRGTPCDVRRRSSTEIILQFNGGSTVDIDTTMLSLLPASNNGPPLFDVGCFTPGSPRVTAHRELLQWHSNRQTPDGLGWLNSVSEYHPSATDPQLKAVISAFIDLLRSAGSHQSQSDAVDSVGTLDPLPTDIRGPICELVGRGPGATPSGDDFLAGMLLVLLGVNDVVIRDAARLIGQSLTTVARDRTTNVSQALLKQACLRRCSRPTSRLLRILTQVDDRPSAEQLRERSLTLVDTGHTSGADTLVGMLAATTIVLPSVVQQRRRYR
jgi:hypothetical protein